MLTLYQVMQVQGQVITDAIRKAESERHPEKVDRLIRMKDLVNRRMKKFVVVVNGK
jgi:hypothetical protein